MGKTVRNYHRKDGSVRQTVSYSRKNIFGTRVVETYSREIAPRKRLTLTLHGWKLVLLIAVGLAVVCGILFAVISADTLIERVIWIVVPIALIVLGTVEIRKIMQASAPAQETLPPPVVSGNNWYCPRCDYKNVMTDRYCRGCNYEFPRERESTPESSDAVQNEWECPGCGGRNPYAVRYCPICNTPKP